MERSAVVNHAQLVGIQDGQVIVPTYNWAKFFKTKCKKSAFKGIKAMHHITFTHQQTGIAIVKDSITSPEREISLLQDKNWKPTAADLPSVIPPPGLSLEPGADPGTLKGGVLRKCLLASIKGWVREGDVPPPA